jgi:hypothetical protein
VLNDTRLDNTEEVARMTHLSRYCPGCGDERPFEQFHPAAASCPDTPDGDCPEWACVACGDAFVIGLLASPKRAPADDGRSRAA